MVSRIWTIRPYPPKLVITADFPHRRVGCAGAERGGARVRFDHRLVSAATLN